MTSTNDYFFIKEEKKKAKEKMKKKEGITLKQYQCSHLQLDTSNFLFKTNLNC